MTNVTPVSVISAVISPSLTVMKSRNLMAALSAAALLAAAPAASAACVNKFLNRTDGKRQVVTLLTGKLTFQEAQELSAAIAKRQAPALEWVDDKGRPLAKQLGELRVVRPMPVGCDGKPSGVIFVATFIGVAPTKKMNVKLDANTIVTFEEQTE